VVKKGRIQMPLALEPNETFEIILESDKDKPRETQPRFIYRHLTCRQWRIIAGFRDRLEELKKDTSATLDKAMGELIKTATTNLVRWVNMIDLQGNPVPFDIEKFEDIVGLAEANELIFKLEDYRLLPVDKKKLDLLSDCGTEASAKDAKDQQNAKTNPQ
jgi:hypothetical protein